MAEVHKMVLQVNGMKYPITTAETEEYVGELGKEIDRSVRAMMENSRISVNEALVLCCLNYLDAYRKSEESADHLRGQIAEYLEEAAKARAEAVEARRELERLESRLKGKEGGN